MGEVNGVHHLIDQTKPWSAVIDESGLAGV